jgi:hypothetical protein
MTPTTTGPLANGRSEHVSGEPESVVERLRRGIAAAALDCRCDEVAALVIDEACAAEDRLRRARGLDDARKMRDAIVVVLALLGELDELDPDEPDRTVFHEIAALFQDVENFAAHGVLSARRAAGRRTA